MTNTVEPSYNKLFQKVFVTDLFCVSLVAIFLDNDAALGLLRKGACSKEDLHHFVHLGWRLFTRLGLEVVFYRVPSDWNCSDPPSRERECPFGSYVGSLSWPPFVDDM